jgi:hypothetical protein
MVWPKTELNETILVFYASKSVKWEYSIVSCVLIMMNLILNNFFVN